jgi:hypothetical protein
MNRKFGQTCLVLALLSLSLAAALWTGLSAERKGLTVQAHVASVQLQGSSEADEGSAAPDADETEKSAACTPSDPHCPSVKQEFALAQAEGRQAPESKAFAAPSDEIPAKFRN